VLQKYGHDFFAKIGRKGQKAMRVKHPDQASEWGKRGGRPKKPSLRSLGRGSEKVEREDMGPAQSHASLSPPQNCTTN
jgi:general stress protein YciG